MNPADLNKKLDLISPPTLTSASSPRHTRTPPLRRCLLLLQPSPSLAHPFRVMSLDSVSMVLVTSLPRSLAPFYAVSLAYTSVVLRVKVASSMVMNPPNFWFCFGYSRFDCFVLGWSTEVPRPPEVYPSHPPSPRPP
jgi:hypothetical protein